MPLRFASLVLLLILAPLARGAFVFDKTTITFSPERAPEHIDTEFPFKNEGDAATTVLDVTTSCGCTVPSLEKKTYAAAEKGVLKVRFEIGDRQGPQNRTISLRTDTGGLQALTLVVNLPVRSMIAPRLHFFRQSDIGDKVTTVTYYNDLPVTLESAISSDPAFTVASVAAKPGSVYTLTTHLPRVPADTVRATVFVRSRGASGAQYLDTYYLRYAPPEQTPPSSPPPAQAKNKRP